MHLPRRHFILLCLLATVNIVAAHAATEPAEDPLVGKWIWHSNQIVTFKADHSCTSSANMDGTWQYVNNPEAQRKYTIIWAHGVYRDKLICSESMQSALLIGEGNKHFDVRRAKD
jgi:hypothetical protein